MSNLQHTQLFRFLKSYYQLKERSVYDVNGSNKYISVLPLTKFGEVDETRSRLLGHADEEEDRVLRVKRPGPPPERPATVTLHADLAPWLAGAIDDHKTTPLLRQRIPQKEQEDRGTETAYWELIDFPRIAPLADRYLAAHAKWRDKMLVWKPLHDAHQRHLELYNKLFEAQRRMEIYAERFELLLGLGLIVFNDGKRVYRRPIIVVPLEAKLTPAGTVELRLAAEVNLFRVENDFLTGSDLDATGATAVLLKELDEGEGDFWDSYDQRLERALGAFSAKLSATARYVAGPPTGPMPTVPTVHHAPMIMLRERSQRSFSVLFDSILEELRENADRQLSLLDRIVMPHDVFQEQYPDYEDERPTSTEEIFLPKESNEEQLKIAEQIDRQDLLVVQGPPGTGKSHTIANVITHLLAQGKKVLVTAKTDQALRALQEHVPPAFHDLMIYFLKGADKSGAELVRSVSRLQDLVENHDRSRMARMATDHHAELKDLRRNRADLQNRIQELRDADVRPTNLNAGYLDQSLADHVTCVLADAPRYEWLKAEEGTDLGEQLSAVASLSDWIERFANGPVRQFNPSARVMLDVPLMPKPIRITELKKKERELEINFPAGTWIIDSTMTDDEIRQRLEEFFSAPVLLARLGWQRALKQDLEQGNDTGWKRRKTTTEEFVKVLSQAEVVSLYQDVEFDIPPGISPKKLRADVLEVGNYRRSGKALTGLMSKFQLTRAVKDREYIYQACTLNGHPATTAVELEKLYHHANVCCALDELDAAWHKYPTESGRTSDKREEYIDRLLQLKEAMYSYPFYERARAQVQEMVGQAAAELEAPDATARLRTAQLAHVARSAVNKIARELRMAESYLSRFAPSDKASKELLDALQRRDAEAYAKGLDDFRELAAMNRLHGELKSAKTRAERVFSATVEAWMLTPGNDLPSKEEITSAIYWRNASEQLIGRFDESVDGLFGQIRRNEKRFREVALEYVRIRATASFVEGLENESAFNSTLVRWMQAAKSSAGRGKKAFKARIAAKEKLREISSDIPCWIMPLYRLADTLTPEPELFDVVIIDEASQLGPEAIFLQYITKKIIVVGDDQQTAPEEVGVEEDKVQGLIRAHLGDIRDRQYYGTNYTFFDHAAANAGRRITLREHFRCMPEIIGFSNELCYAPLGTALIPLKQFRGDRLPPLKTQFISNGTFYRDVNEPEAEAIVSRIQAIMADPLYAGKTIGVITLQGNNQHVVIKSLLDAAAQSKGFSEESKTRRLVVGKPADFQGDERDIILLSLVTALDHRRNSVSGANYKRRYNVAMSRAKEQVILFHSVQLDDLKPNDLRYKLLHYFTKRSLGESLGVEVIPSGPLDVPPGQPFDSWFEVDVYRDLTEKGYLVQPQYPVGSYRIDLVVHLENGSRVAVECDGDFWHGPEHIEQDTIRQLQLERSGWEFYRIRYSQYKYDKASALDALWDLLKEREKLVVPKIVKSTHKGSELEEITADTRSYILQGTEETASVKPELPITAVIVDEAWGEMVEDRNKSAIGIPSDQPVQAVKSDVASDNNTPPHSPITGKPGDEWLIFTDGANVIKYKIGMNSLPNLLGEEKDIYRVSAISPYRFMIFAFENGRVDKVEMRAFGTSRSRVKNAYNEDAALIFIAGFREDTDLAAIATNNKVVVFSTSTLGLHSSRANKGNLVFKRGSEVSEVKLLSETNFVDDDFYRRSTLNVTGYYLKEDDSF